MTSLSDVLKKADVNSVMTFRMVGNDKVEVYRGEERVAWLSSLGPDSLVVSNEVKTTITHMTNAEANNVVITTFSKKKKVGT